jgi:hypothetical protein
MLENMHQYLTLKSEQRFGSFQLCFLTKKLYCTMQMSEKFSATMINWFCDIRSGCSNISV